MNWLPVVLSVGFALAVCFAIWLNIPQDIILVKRTEKLKSTEAYPWPHPVGYPYQVIGGPLMYASHDLLTWTNQTELEGYELVEDYYSDRLYFIPKEYL